MANLSADLQSSITELQTQHTALVQAVRNYTGGSVSTATNDLLAAKDAVLDTIANSESSLLGRVAELGSKPVPSILLDFESGTYMVGTRRLERGAALDELVDADRASECGGFGPDGKYRIIPSQVSRIEYDRETGECLGLVVESSAANYISFSEIQGDSTPLSGSRSDWDTELDTTLGIALGRLSIAAVRTEDKDTSANTWCWSCFVKIPDAPDTHSNTVLRGEIHGDTNKTVNMWYDHDAGEYLAGGNAYEYGTINLGGGYARIWFSIQATDIGSVYRIRTATYGSDKWVGGFQVETGTSPTGYIKTSGSASLRNGDGSFVRLPNSINPQYGTVLMDFKLFPDATPSGTRYALFRVCEDRQAVPSISLTRDQGRDTTLRYINYTPSGSQIGNTNAATIDPTTFNKISLRYSPVEVKVDTIYSSRGLADSDEFVGVDGYKFNYIFLGRDSGFVARTLYIKSLRVFPRVLTDDEIAEVLND